MASQEFPIDFSARHIGWLVLEWSHFECALEMISCRILEINERQSSIIFASLSYKAKKDICVSLLLEEPNEENRKLVSLIAEIEQTATRNHIVHSILAQNPKADRISFLKRSVDSGLKTKRKDFSSSSLEKMINKLHSQVTELFRAARISDGEQIGYLDVTHS